MGRSGDSTGTANLSVFRLASGAGAATESAGGAVALLYPHRPPSSDGSTALLLGPAGTPLRFLL
jgi:hypothetical protein